MLSGSNTPSKGTSLHVLLYFAIYVLVCGLFMTLFDRWWYFFSKSSAAQAAKLCVFMARTLTVMLWAELRSVVGGGLSSACLLVAVIMVVRFIQACLKI